MFGNFSAQAGVIAKGTESLDTRIQWNFNNVLTIDFAPYGTNVNDRPRMNFFRFDGNYVTYLSGGKDVFSPFPNGRVNQPWGDRIVGDEIISIPTNTGDNFKIGIDLFSHTFAPLKTVFPPFENGWTGITGENPGEIKYQYLLIPGQKKQLIQIELDYSGCSPPTLPFSCNRRFSYRLINDCPQIICETGVWFEPYFWKFNKDPAGTTLCGFKMNAPLTDIRAIIAYWSEYEIEVNTQEKIMLFPNEATTMDNNPNFCYTWSGEGFDENNINNFQLKNILTGNSGSQFGSSVASNIDSSVIIIGAPSDYNFKGGAFIYTGDMFNGWSIKQRLTGFNNFGKFGNKVISNNEGTVLGVSSFDFGPDNVRIGSGFIFTGSKTHGWKLKQSFTGDHSYLGEFGKSMDISEDNSILIFGAPYDGLGGFNAGSIFIYTGSEINGWELKQRLTGSFDSNLGFSSKISKDGTVILAGTPAVPLGQDNFQGQAWIYTGSIDNGWNLKQKISGEDLSSIFLGWDVNMNDDGSLLIISDPFNQVGQVTGAGLTFLYTGSSLDSWSYKQKFSGTKLYDYFGKSLSSNNDGSTLLIGKPVDIFNVPGGIQGRGVDINEGIIYKGIFLNNWAQNQKLSGLAYGQFGESVFINNNGNVALLGGPQDNLNGNNAGAVMIYTGNRWIEHKIRDTWNDVGISDNGQYQTAISRSNIWISNDYGNNWRLAFNKLEQDPKDWWKKIAVSDNGRFQTVVRSFGKIWASNDYGETWSQTETPDNFWQNIAMNGNGQYQTAVAAGAQKIYVSSDYGYNWQPKGDTTAEWIDIFIDKSGGYQRAVANNPEGVATSFTFGNNWGSILNTPFLKIFSSNDRKYQSTFQNGKIVVSQDSGVSWSDKIPFFDNGFIVGSKSGQHQSAVSFNKVYNTRNYGDTWEEDYELKKINSLKININGKHQIASQYNNYLYTLGIPPLKKPEVYKPLSWTKVKTTNQFLTSIAVSQNGQYQTAVALSNGSIWVSNDYGFNWVEKIIPGSWSDIAMSPDGQYQTATRLDGKIWKSDNFGVSWAEVTNSLPGQWISISVSTRGQYQTAIIFNQGIYTSYDYGNSWEQSLLTFNVNDIKIRGTTSTSTPDGLYQIAVGIVSYVTVDAGQTWVPSNNNLPLGSNPKIAIAPDNTINTVVSPNSKILRNPFLGFFNTYEYRDRNRSWRDIAISYNSQYQTAVAFEDKIWSSDDFGESWVPSEQVRQWTSIDMSSQGFYRTATVANGDIYILSNS
jgi:photosystem II stability/assembly factor-like uncharacterized protein